MRVNLPIRNAEHVLRAPSAMTSQTDLDGRITRVDRAFAEASGFTATELLGQSHSVLRHPDMPPQAFADMWESLELGLPWTGMVKNRRKNGEFYWVLSHVTPLRRHGRTEGYLSVHSTPERAQVKAAESLYGAIREARAGAPTLHRGELLRPAWRDPVGFVRRLPVRGRVRAVTAAAALLALVFGAVGWQEASRLVAAAGVPTWLPAGVATAAGLIALAIVGLGQFMDRAVLRPLAQAAAMARGIACGERMSCGAEAQAETRHLLQALQQMNAKLLSIAADGRATSPTAAVMPAPPPGPEVAQPVDFVERTAFQANIAALNAAVEAARAKPLFLATETSP